MDENERYSEVCKPWMDQHGKLIRDTHKILVGNGNVGLCERAGSNTRAIRGMYIFGVLILTALIGIWLK